MLSMQDGAAQLLSDAPGSLYFLTGPDYGVKRKYIDHVSGIYGGNVVETESFAALVDDLSRTSLFPRPSTLYIARYDKDLISNLDADLAKSLKSMRFSGTIIGIYQEDKSEKKLDKFFPDCTLRVNPLSEALQLKHLKSDHPGLDDGIVAKCIKVGGDYIKASNMCDALELLGQTEASSMSQGDLVDLFGCEPAYDKQRFKQAVTRRSTGSMYKMLDAHDSSDYSEMLYDMLSALFDVAKALESGKPSSVVPIEALRKWSLPQVKHMFDIIYEQISLIRSQPAYSQETALLYTISMFNFSISA